jgi:hypothetical protein
MYRWIEKSNAVRMTVVSYPDYATGCGGGSPNTTPKKKTSTNLTNLPQSPKPPPKQPQTTPNHHPNTPKSAQNPENRLKTPKIGSKTPQNPPQTPPSRPLKHLDLRCNTIGPAGAATLARALAVAPRPVAARIDLRQNRIDAEGKKKLEEIAMERGFAVLL